MDQPAWRQLKRRLRTLGSRAASALRGKNTAPPTQSPGTSPPGREQVFVYRMRIQDHRGVPGTLRSLAPSGKLWQPMIDPSGSRVAYWGTDYSEPGQHLFLSELDGSSTTKLTRGASVNGHPCWQADGSRLAYFSTDGVSSAREWQQSKQFDVNRPSSNIFILKLGQDQRERVTEGNFVDERPTLSPDGNAVVFVSNRSGALQLWSVQCGGDGLRQLTSGTRLDYRPVFSPTGDRIAYFSDNGDGVHRLAVVDWPQGTPRQPKLKRRFDWIHGPFWSSDGRRLLVHGKAKRDRRPRLWIVDGDTGTCTRLELPGVESCSHGTWDRDERWLCFDSREDYRHLAGDIGT